MAAEGIPEPTDSRPLSEVLAAALSHDANGAITAGEVADRIGDRGFGLLLILLALPTMIPVLPPGASIPVGAAYTLLGLQMLLGRRRPWLPGRFRRYRLSAKAAAALSGKGAAFVRRCERLSRPRLEACAGPGAERIASVVIVGVGIVLILPLPFMNTLPGIAMLLLGLGFTNRDGLLAIIGGSLGAGSVVVVMLFGRFLVSFGAYLRNLVTR